MRGSKICDFSLFLKKKEKRKMRKQRKDKVAD